MTKTTILGILNLTPDSFSGDGMQYSSQKAIEKLDRFIADGAGGIDIGAESTRPGATLLSPDEEWARLEPVIKEAAARIDKVQFSIDTRHSETAKRFLHSFPKPKASSLYLNDVSSHKSDTMINLVKEYGANLIMMHSLTVPADPKTTIPGNENAVETVFDWAQELIKNYGKDIIIDPGIGFGKTAEQSFAILKNISWLQSLGARVMVGHSRKSFLSLFTDKKAEERDPETLLLSHYLAVKKVDYLRVHDVKSHVSMLKIKEAL